MKLKKIKLLLLGMIFLGLLGGLTACGKKGAKDNSVKRIQNKKTIVLGTSADAPPFEYTAMKNGKKKIVGFDIMLGQKIADDLGVKLKVENIAFSTLVTELQDKKVDMVLSSMIPTAEGKKAVSFSDPYYKAGNVLMIKRSDLNKYRKISDLDGASIGAQQGSANEKIAKTQLPDTHLVSEGNLGTLTTELKVGKLKGVVLGEEDAKAYQLKYPDVYTISKIKLKISVENSSISVGLNKDDKDLKKRIDKVINKLKKSGELDKMLDQAQKEQLRNS